jgi:hypothetical protein
LRHVREGFLCIGDHGAFLTLRSCLVRDELAMVMMDVPLVEEGSIDFLVRARHWSG